MSRRRWLLAICFGMLVAAALPMAGRALLWRWESNPVLRGRLLSRELGCDSCHRPFGSKEIENPGSRWGSVPSFQSGNAFMYLRDRQELEDMIRFGAPGGKPEGSENHQRPTARHPTEQRLRMPAYGEWLSEAELADLVSLVQAEESFELSEKPEATAGRALARRLGCPSCHGAEGAGGLSNPGSLGGFIPGFLGRNFGDLVQGREEFFEWIRTGGSRRLEAKAVVRFFWNRQVISMPAYGDSLTEGDLNNLWAWVLSARSHFSPSEIPETTP